MINYKKYYKAKKNDNKICLTSTKASEQLTKITGCKVTW